ncbi:MAG: FHA domain-containing protein [Anaerolineae bacterium]|nr:FHA domain-containing protein [Anaerolineae bacterium]
MAKKTPISRFESLAQELIEGSLGRLLGGSVTPADIAARLTRVLEDSVINGTVADTYHVKLHPADLETLVTTYPHLETELQTLILHLAQQENLRLLADPHVVLGADGAMKRHEVRVQAMRQRRVQETTQLRPENAVTAEVMQALVDLDAYLIVDGRHHIPLDKPIMTIGRRADNDVVLDLATVSRRHAQLRWRYGHFVLYDLSQRQGRTSVNNQPIAECVLQPGDVITLSQVKLLYAEGQTTPKRGGHNADGADTQVMPPANEEL